MKRVKQARDLLNKLATGVLVNFMPGYHDYSTQVIGKDLSSPKV